MYDLVIIGGGPGGLTAGLYAARANLKTVLIERGLHGGQMQNTLEIENYPGFKSVDGPTLSEHMYEQAIAAGLLWKTGEVEQVCLAGKVKSLEVEGQSIQARTVIIASGALPRYLDVPGEKEFTGRGVSYCATCDGAFFRDRDVVVVGGGDAAVKEGIFLTRYAASVTIIHRRDALRAVPVLQERAFANPKIKFAWDTVVEEIKGEGKVSAVSVRNVKTGAVSSLPTEGVFVYIGFLPNSAFLQGSSLLNEEGCVLTDAKMATQIPGVFAVGDVRFDALRQIVSAAGEGAIAAMEAYHYLENL